MAVLPLAGCDTDGELPFVRLEPPLQAAQVEEDAQEEVFRIGAAAIFSPVSAFQQYAGLMSYLSDALGQPVAFVQRSTYFEINELVRSGDLGCALICSGAYVLNGDGLEVLVTPVVDGAPTYQAVCLAPAGSATRSLEDLRGATFAMTDPLSFSGRAYIGTRLAELGTTPEQFFGRTYQVEGHDSLVRLIANRSVDAGCVNSLVYDQLKKADPDTFGGLQVVERSASYGAPPVVVSESLDPAVRRTLLSTFEEMPLDPRGREILSELGVDRFEPPPPDLYRPLQELIAGQERVSVP